MWMQVTTYKVLTVQRGAHYQRLRQETIPEGGAVLSSPDGSSNARGTGDTTNSGSPGMNLMETWCDTALEHTELLPSSQELL